MNWMEEGKLHFVLVPLLTQGHIIPMVDFARLLAGRGVLVSLITTPVNLARIQPLVARVEESGLPVRFVPLRLPCEEVGLPEGCENFDLVPNSSESMNNLRDAMEMLREPLLLHLRRNPPLPSCIVSDMYQPWTRHVARDLEVPRFDFYTMCCFTLLCDHNLRRHKVCESVSDDATPVVVPGLPRRVEVTRAQAPALFGDGPGWETFVNEILAAEWMSCGGVVNSCVALEPDYIKAFQSVKEKKIWAIGPVSLGSKDAGDKALRGDKADICGEKCLLWLDSMKPRSVLYVSFGSLMRTPLSQIVEIGMGLEATQCPFIWVIKPGDQHSKVEEWLAAGFEERTRGRALIIRGWAPQVTILSHPSVGGFLTHCGWNSSLEAISAGVPMITWPRFADQFLNERFTVDILGVGVGVGVKEVLWLGNEKSDVVIEREDVQRAVERLMDAGEEGEEMRKRARDLAEMAREAMEFGGSSHMNLTQFIDEVMRLAAKKMHVA